MKIFRILSLILTIYQFPLSVNAEVSLPADYIDLSGVYSNPACKADDSFITSELLGSLDLIQPHPKMKLHINQKISGAIQNGEEFKIVEINTFIEEDQISKEISKVVFDSRTGKSLDPGYSFQDQALLFHQKEIINSRDILGYRSRTKLINKESIKLIGQKLMVEGTIETSKITRTFFIIPTIQQAKVYHYRCQFLKND